MDLASNLNIWSFDVFRIPRFEVLEALDKGFKSKFERAACISVLNKLFTACHVLESKLGLVVLLTNFENYLFWTRNFAQIIFGGAEKFWRNFAHLRNPTLIGTRHYWMLGLFVLFNLSCPRGHIVQTSVG